MRKLVYSGVLLIGVAFAAFWLWPAQPPELAVFLRCGPEVTGNLTLSGSALPQNRTLNMVEACATGSIEFETFDREGTVIALYENDAGARAELNLADDGSIGFSNAEDYFVLLEVSGTAPFLVVSLI